MLTGDQVRSARVLLSWSEERLADAACISTDAVRRFEAGGTVQRLATSDVLRRALESAGAEFVPDNGSVCVHYRRDPTPAEALRGDDVTAANDD